MGINHLADYRTNRRIRRLPEAGTFQIGDIEYPWNVDLTAIEDVVTPMRNLPSATAAAVLDPSRMLAWTASVVKTR